MNNIFFIVTSIHPNNNLKFMQLNQEFENLSLMFEGLFLISKKDDIKLRVPISSLLEYKGFRCLAIGNIPVTNDYPPALGLNNDQ